MVVGVNAREICFGEATARFAVALKLPTFAVMVAGPIPWPVMVEDDIVAAFEDPAVHLAKAVTSWAEPSLNLPVAEKVIAPPGAMKALAGITEIESRVAGVTFNGVDAWIEPNVDELLAFNVVDPADLPVTVYWLLEAEATEVSSTDQLT